MATNTKVPDSAIVEAPNWVWKVIHSAFEYVARTNSSFGEISNEESAGE
jgi:hypothetical protein